MICFFFLFLNKQINNEFFNDKNYNKQLGECMNCIGCCICFLFITIITTSIIMYLKKKRILYINHNEH